MRSVTAFEIKIEAATHSSRSPSLPPSLPSLLMLHRTFCVEAGISIEELRERVRGLTYLLQDLPHGEMAELNNKVREIGSQGGREGRREGGRGGGKGGG